MDVKFDALPAAERSIVYIRAVQVADLPADVQAKVGFPRFIPSTAPMARGWLWWPTATWPSCWRASMRWIR